MAVDVIEEEETIEFSGPWSGITKRLTYEYDDIDGNEFELRDASVELDPIEVETWEGEGADGAEAISTGVEEGIRAKQAVQGLAGLKARSADSLDRSVRQAIKNVLPGVELF